MIGLGYLALGIAVLANFSSNLAFQRAMQQVEGGSLGEILWSLLGSFPFWLGIGFAMVLLGAYLFAIRILPLGTSYAAVTALTIALLTTWGFWSGSDTLTWAKVTGILAIIVGFVLITGPFGNGQ